MLDIRTTTVNPNPAFEPFESHYKTLSVFPFALPQVLALGCPVQPPLKKLLDVVGVVISGLGCLAVVNVFNSLSRAHHSKQKLFCFESSSSLPSFSSSPSTISTSFIKHRHIIRIH
jgi:hypothetical protein